MGFVQTGLATPARSRFLAMKLPADFKLASRPRQEADSLRDEAALRNDKRLWVLFKLASRPRQKQIPCAMKLRCGMTELISVQTGAFTTVEPCPASGWEIVYDSCPQERSYFVSSRRSYRDLTGTRSILLFVCLWLLTSCGGGAAIRRGRPCSRSVCRRLPRPWRLG